MLKLKTATVSTQASQAADQIMKASVGGAGTVNGVAPETVPMTAGLTAETTAAAGANQVAR